MPTVSHWSRTAVLRRFAPLSEDLKVDVVVVGGGHTGVTAAYLLKKAGQTVALLERDHCAGADTAHTSAHLTHVTDLRLSKMVAMQGRDHAQAVWDAGIAAIHQIEKTIREENIACDFSRTSAFLCASLSRDRDERSELQAEAQLASDLGFPATYVNSVPVFDRPGVQFANQARFHPLKYLGRLLEQIPGGGSHVFEGTEVTEVGSDPLCCQANGHTILCEFIVIATDVPIQGRTNSISATLLQSKIAPYTSYVVGAKLSKGLTPDVLVWDTSEPYFYFRLDPHVDYDYILFGGKDHKTGQITAADLRFSELEATLQTWIPAAELQHRWSGQVIEAVDGLPYIGETADRQFVATGFSGNGLTFGTIAAMMACDAALGRKSLWRSLFDVRRKTLSSTWSYLRENADYPYYLIKDRLAPSDGTSLEAIPPGEGKLIDLNGQRVAAYRDREGRVITLSPRCTHLGCTVRWNNAENTWDCPCHGSRFKANGDVLSGPAETRLAEV